MTAAHYIALLLLSTAGKETREHREIIELNGPGVWVALSELQLVERHGEHGLWRLTERGAALVEHVITLPLPERVMAWRMPSSGVSIETVARLVSAPIVQPPAADSDPEVPPPKPPAPKPIQGVVPEESAAARHAQARELLDRGFGVQEVAETLELELPTVEGIFFGNGQAPQCA